MHTEQPFLSVIIPAYNEEQRLPDSLMKVAAYLEQQPYAKEVIVVENGSSDRTMEIAEEFAARYPFIQAIRAEGRGKGLAVRTGMLAAKGQHRFMCDADLSMPIDEVYRFLPPKIEDTEVVIGSREAEGAVRYNEPEHRHWGGRLVNLVIRLLALPGLRDTQCGFKCFSAEAAEDLFTVQTIDGWSFDIEIIFIARKRGYTIKEIGIPWYYADMSHVSPVKDAIRLIFDIFDVRWKALTGKYRR